MLFELYVLPNGNAIQLESIKELRIEHQPACGHCALQLINSDGIIDSISCLTKKDCIDLRDDLILDFNKKIRDFKSQLQYNESNNPQEDTDSETL